MESYESSMQPVLSEHCVSDSTLKKEVVEKWKAFDFRLYGWGETKICFMLDVKLHNKKCGGKTYKI